MLPKKAPSNRSQREPAPDFLQGDVLARLRAGRIQPGRGFGKRPVCPREPHQGLEPRPCLEPSVSLPPESVERLAYKQDPDGCENRSEDYGCFQGTDKKGTHNRNNPKNARGQAQIGDTLAEDSI